MDGFLIDVELRKIEIERNRGTLVPTFYTLNIKSDLSPKLKRHKLVRFVFQTPGGT